MKKKIRKLIVYLDLKKFFDCIRNGKDIQVRKKWKNK
jgi:hypothetical protein